MDFLDALTIDDLDGDLRWIAEALGLDAACYFLAAWNGTQIYVPAPPGSSPALDEIETALGRDAATRLQALWGGCALYIPARRRLEDAWAARQIRADYDGSNVGELVARYRVSRRLAEHALTEHDLAGS